MTIRLDDDLYDDDLYIEVKRLAAGTGKTVSAFIEDSLRVTLAGNQATGRSPLNLHTFTGRGLFPGVNLDHSQELLDLMEKPRGLK